MTWQHLFYLKFSWRNFYIGKFPESQGAPAPPYWVLSRRGRKHLTTTKAGGNSALSCRAQNYARHSSDGVVTAEVWVVTGKNVNDEPWFVAKDVAEILGYSETAKMLRRLNEDECKKIVPPEMGGANFSSMAREITIINESGLYNAALGSTKPEAKAFKKWVTSEVLPSIRKHGGYIAANGSTSQGRIFGPALFGTGSRFHRP